MKLYHFNPNDYGEEWFVMATSEENAIKALNKELEFHYYNQIQWGDDYFKNYTINSFDENVVIRSEIA